MMCTSPPTRLTPKERDALCRWIEQVQWAVFVTLEWRRTPDPENVPNQLRLFFSVLNRRLVGRDYFQRKSECAAWLAIAELRRVTVPHAHALVAYGGPAEDLWRALLHAGQVWRRKFGFSHCDRVRNGSAACMYLAGHGMRDLQIEFSPNLGDWLRS